MGQGEGKHVPENNHSSKRVLKYEHKMAKTGRLVTNQITFIMYIHYPAGGPYE